MDSHFINFDGRSVHDMIELLLAASGDPEAIRRLQESINAVDLRAQSSIAVVNTAVENLGNEVDVVANAGAKNLLPNRGVDTYTNNGITFTKNSDGSVTANGTATAEAVYYVILNTSEDSFNFSPEYVMTGCPEGGDTTKYQLAYRVGKKVGNVYVNAAVDFGQGVRLISFDGSTEQVNVNISIKNGQTVDNLVFKPMIRKAAITDDTYVPYGKTNAALTEDTGWITVESDINDFAYRKKNDVVFLKALGSAKKAFPTVAPTIVTLPESFRPSVVIIFTYTTRNSSGSYEYKMTNYGFIEPSGAVRIHVNTVSDIAIGDQIIVNASYPV